MATKTMIASVKAIAREITTTIAETTLDASGADCRSGMTCNETVLF